jgi:hypothetical protein
VSTGRTNGKGVDGFLQDKRGEKMNADENQDNQLDGIGARNNAQETVEAMVPVEADWDSDDN